MDDNQELIIDNSDGHLDNVTPDNPLADVDSTAIVGIENEDGTVNYGDDDTTGNINPSADTDVETIEYTDDMLANEFTDEIVVTDIVEIDMTPDELFVIAIYDAVRKVTTSLPSDDFIFIDNVEVTSDDIRLNTLVAKLNSDATVSVINYVLGGDEE